jgi:hypothetical protein
MFYGFAAVFALLILYVVTLVFRDRSLRQQIDTLKRTLTQEKS